jgi:hypothetical protein
MSSLLPQLRWRTAERGESGVTFLELGAILALVAVVCVIGWSLLCGARANAKRVRCRNALLQLHRIEVLHHATHGDYTEDLAALEELGLPSPLDPVYGFALSHQPGRGVFRCVATANLDHDAALDSLAITEDGEVVVLARD